VSFGGQATVNTEPWPGAFVTVTSPPHHAGEPAGDGKAQAGTAEVLRGRGIGAWLNSLEQLGLLLRCHSDAGG
jgi:hypothetical protein